MTPNSKVQSYYNFKPIIIDGRNHILGRLSSIVAKQLLLGKSVIVVRCEGIIMSGNFKRMKYIYKMFLRKRMNTNPRHGPFHYRSPAKILVKSVRGMLPSRTERGKSALKRLQTFVGVPTPFSTKQRMVVPRAHKVLCLSTSSPVSLLSTEYGWKYLNITNTLEEKRKKQSLTYYSNKLKAASLVRKAKVNLGEKLKDIESKLLNLGYVCL